MARGAERPSSAVATTRRGARLAQDRAASRRSLQIVGAFAEATGWLIEVPCSMPPSTEADGAEHGLLPVTQVPAAPVARLLGRPANPGLRRGDRVGSVVFPLSDTSTWVRATWGADFAVLYYVATQVPAAPWLGRPASPVANRIWRVARRAVGVAWLTWILRVGEPGRVVLASAALCVP